MTPAGQQNASQTSRATGTGRSQAQRNTAVRPDAAAQNAQDTADAQDVNGSAEDTAPAGAGTALDETGVMPETEASSEESLIEAKDAEVPLAGAPEEAEEEPAGSLLWLLLILPAAAIAWILILFFRKKKEEA